MSIEWRLKVSRNEFPSGKMLRASRRLKVVDLIFAGHHPEEVARQCECSINSVGRVVSATGGMPSRRTRSWQGSGHHLSASEREEIRVGITENHSLRSIARGIGRPCSTVSREVKRNGGRRDYSATRAHDRACEKAVRPKKSKLLLNHRLRAEVIRQLELLHSPEQISATMKLEFPSDPEMRISHETIYQSLFVQSRGALRKDLTKCLRTGRTRRKRQGSGSGRGKINGMIMVSERPAEVEDRAVPGHWEGDLIAGKGNRSFVGTLVERQTRFVMLTYLGNDRRTETTCGAIAGKILTLREDLRRTLTWDQGSEMAGHLKFTIDTGAQVYFCDPHSPWQRGSNENTNGLLRQYLPKGTDLAVHGQVELDAIASSLNRRPRKTLDWKTPSEKMGKLLLR